MSGASFAKTHGIRYTTFANWVQRRRKMRRGAAPAPKFAEVVVHAGGSGATRLSVALPGGGNTEISTVEEAALAAALLNEIARGSERC